MKRLLFLFFASFFTSFPKDPIQSAPTIIYRVGPSLFQSIFPSLLSTGILAGAACILYRKVKSCFAPNEELAILNQTATKTFNEQVTILKNFTNTTRIKLEGLVTDHLIPLKEQMQKSTQDNKTGFHMLADLQLNSGKKLHNDIHELRIMTRAEFESLNTKIEQRTAELFVKFTTLQESVDINNKELKEEKKRSSNNLQQVNTNLNTLNERLSNIEQLLNTIITQQKTLEKQSPSWSQTLTALPATVRELPGAVTGALKVIKRFTTASSNSIALPKSE